MRKTFSLITLLATVLLLLQSQSIVFANSSLMTDTKVQVNNPRFLNSPFYGSEVINSIFDHTSPTYNLDSNPDLRRWNGTTATNISNPCNQVGLQGNCYSGHDGIDFGLSYETVLSAAQGSVSFVGWEPGYAHNAGLGLYLRIDHTIDGIDYRTIYGHMSSIIVKYGQPVNAGDPIGVSGNSGSSTGPHLHFVVQVNVNGSWKPIDPFGWQPLPGTPQTDPWPHTSWCMWRDGQWTYYCPEETQPSRLIQQPRRGNGDFIVDDSIYNLNGFNKGYGGPINSSCTGVNPSCSGWFESSAGYGGHTYRILNDSTVPDQWAKWTPPITTSTERLFEIYVWLPSISGISMDTFTWEAKYKIKDSNGNMWTAIVDQNAQGSNTQYNKWLLIGSYYLNNNAYVYLTDATGEDNLNHCPTSSNQDCRISVDAVKFVEKNVSVSDIRTPGSGITSQVVVRNNGSGSVTPKVAFYAQYGTYCGSAWPNIPSNGSAYVDVPVGCSSPASALVNARQDVSISVLHTSTTNVDADNGFNTDGSLAFESPGSSLYAPAVYSNIWNSNSVLKIANIGKHTVSVEIRLKGRPGYSDRTITTSIFPGARYVLNPYNDVFQTAWVGSAEIYGSDPYLIGMAEETRVSSYVRTYNLTNLGSPVLYAPALYKEYYNFTSGLIIQNTGTATTPVVAYFYNRDGSLALSYPFGPIESGRSTSLFLSSSALPSNWAGSVIIKNENGVGQPIAATVNAEQTVGNIFSYNAESRSYNTVYLPISEKSVNGRISSYLLMNTSETTSMDVVMTYYNQDGTIRYKPSTTTVNAKGSLGFYLGSEANLPTGWSGSVLIQSIIGNLVAIIRDDTSYSISACNGVGR